MTRKNKGMDEPRANQALHERPEGFENSIFPNDRLALEPEFSPGNLKNHGQ